MNKPTEPKRRADIYSNWLGITDPERPLSHYQLLRLKKFEDDANAIRNNYQKMTAHVRKYLASEHADKAHALLDELSKAMVCLTDSRRKSEYDASLGRAVPSEPSKKGGGSFEEILVSRKIVDAAQLAKAKSVADAIGVDLRDAIVQQKLAKPEVVLEAYADSLGLSYRDVSKVELDPELIAKMPPVLARQHSVAPLAVEGGKVLIASPNPLRAETEEEVRLRFGIPVKVVLCTPAAIHEIVNKHYPREAAAASMGVTAAADRPKSKLEMMDPVERAQRRKQVLMVCFMMTFVAFSILGTVLGWAANFPGPDIFGMKIYFYTLGFVLAGIAAGIGYKFT
jgi:hypothetical protein